MNIPASDRTSNFIFSQEEPKNVWREAQQAAIDAVDNHAKQYGLGNNLLTYHVELNYRQSIFGRKFINFLKKEGIGKKCPCKIASCHCNKNGRFLEYAHIIPSYHQLHYVKSGDVQRACADAFQHVMSMYYIHSKAPH